jgi:ADP-ribose pyrophosphatase YjhB (NUDIX family)
MILRLLMTLAYRLAHIWWFVRRPVTFGVRAIALTAAGEIVLVRHSYLPGWYCPGGGRARNETAEAAAIRELREEIGMTAYGSVGFLRAYTVHQHFKRDTVSWFLVRDVAFTARRSLEIVEIRAFPLDALPEDMTSVVRERLRAALEMVPDLAA